LVLQCSGLPSHRDSIVAKTAIATVADAVGLGADAVAVELNMNAPSLLDGVTRVAQTITDATSRSMPVLVMVTPSASDDTVDAFADALRIASELGADLIKVGMPTELLKMSDAELGDMRMLLAAAPPTLLAGGPTNATLLTTAKRAREAGFAGVCIGRNIFESPDAPGLCCDLSAVFADASGPPPC
jgi:DhnA family fructose-bisphosphate aldolase class Ia